MLVLTRRTGEEVFFTLTKPMPAGTRIVVVVSGVKGNQVHLGISADRSITVDRAEIDALKRNEDVDGNR